MTENEPTETESKKLVLRNLLPAAVTHPLTMLITIAVPQVILLILNLRSYHLLSGEIDASQKKLAIAFFAAELIILIGGCLLALWQWRKSTLVKWRWNWAIFIPPVVYLALFTMKADSIVPTALQLWIVPPATSVFYQFVFLMPSIFLAALGLACFPMRISVGKDIGTSLGLAIGTPLLWYLFLSIGLEKLFRNIPSTLIFLMVVAFSMVCLTGVLRLLTLLFTWALGKGRFGQSILIAVVSLVAPIGGLLLNSKFPFPADFQIWPVYALTILNGIVLTIPSFYRPKLDRAMWLIQCTLFPFTLYFFLTFLPYLPLASIAIIAAGAGFLILSPTALFVIHLKKLVQGLPSRKFIPLGILAALILPAYAQIEMMIDRSVLHQAIDYVYSPDLKNDGHFQGSRNALRRSLLRLQNVKAGVELPFLTQWYNQVVLDGLVLNDEKMSHLYFTFFGDSLPKVEERNGSLFGRRNNRGFGGVRMTPPPKNAVLRNVTHSVSSDPENGTRTLVKLELHNPSGTQSEFATTINLPDGVFVSGYWLHVGDERVPGQIFEKKTAMWIYRMIRDASRRDPGLLTYTAPNRISLRVFPFAANETRITEIEFLSAPGYKPEIQIGEKIISGENTNSELVVSKIDNTQQTVFIPLSAVAKANETIREPFLHFIVDRSSTGLSAEDSIVSMKEVALKHPTIKSFAITLANYEFVDFDKAMLPIGSLSKDSTKKLIESLPKQGALLAEHSMQRVLSRFKIRQTDSEDLSDTLRFPLIVLVKSVKTHGVRLKKLTWYASATPDVDGYYIKTHGDDPVLSKNFSDGKIVESLSIKPVLIFAAGKSRTVIAATSDSAVGLLNSQEAIKIYDSNLGEFTPLNGASTTSIESDYSKALDVVYLESEIRWNPSSTNDRLSTIVDKSRDSGILTPSTAYIVVENSAQWKMLKRKEKEKLKGNHALDFMEAPEPHLLLIILVFALFLFMKKQRNTIGKTASS